jgi:hypothetical protein
MAPAAETLLSTGGSFGAIYSGIEAIYEYLDKTSI